MTAAMIRTPEGATVSAQSFRIPRWAWWCILLVTAAWALCSACASTPQIPVEDAVDIDAAVWSVVRGQSPPVAVLAVDNSSGEIVHTVVVGETSTVPLGGGRRPAASVMKVVVLAAGLEAGIPADHVLDAPRCLRLSGHRACTPTPGELTVEEAMASSNNPAFVMLTDLVGPEAVVEYGLRLGMDLGTTSAVSLGIDPVSMESVAALFVALANEGETLTIRDRAGTTLIQETGPYVSVRTARLLRSVLRSVVTKGTGMAADGPDEPFGKTGTAEGRTDAWFVGATDAWTIVVWAGSEDGTTAVEPPRYPTALAGSGLPAQIFRAVADELCPQARPSGESP